MSDAATDPPDDVPSDPSPAPPPPYRPPVETLIARSLQLRCPRCGKGRLFCGWFTMPERCSECNLKYERAPGYFLGSTYINYGITAAILTVLYMTLHFGAGISNRHLALPLGIFCVLFPLFTFRYARALWLAMDCHFDRSVMSGEED
ncbi:MAG: DUF983 domain-containing protein [Maioricimonas sp. JB049]